MIHSNSSFNRKNSPKFNLKKRKSIMPYDIKHIEDIFDQKDVDVGTTKNKSCLKDKDLKNLRRKYKEFETKTKS